MDVRPCTCHPDDRPPLLFETMVFDGPKGRNEIDMQRYSTWDEAERGHIEMVKRVANSRSKISSESA